MKYVKLLVTIFIISFFVSLFFSDYSEGNVALVRIDGEIMYSDGNYFKSHADVDTISTILDDIKQDNNIKAVIFLINSPGGSAAATDELAEKISKINKTTISVIRDVGASGAYWIATATDEIVANRLSIVGSIGTTFSYLSFGNTLKDYNISYNRLVSGDYKDMGSPLKELTPNEREKLKKIIDNAAEYFIQTVAKNRNMSIDDVRKIATGEFFLGQEAKELGLIDHLGTLEDAKEIISNKINATPEIVEYQTEDISFIGRLMGFVNPPKLESDIRIKA